ncbi:MAG: hypothetical protein ACRCS5_15790 [Sphingomonas sp.]|jgi:predicted transcriptional regulator|uniref:hypothetical protein n=1 Tax=Sphingomonas sp. TaxID=28214 RepID=UPI0030F5BB14
MAQILVRQIDDATITRLETLARERKTSVESAAREAIHQPAQLTVAEKLEIVRKMQEWSRRAQVPGVPQTPGIDLIREGRGE